jgi:hypothetical protein
MFSKERSRMVLAPLFLSPGLVGRRFGCVQLKCCVREHLRMSCLGEITVYDVNWNYRS